MRTLYAMSEKSVKKFLSVSRDVRESARGMTAEDMRGNIAEVYKMARINSSARRKADNAPLYEIDSDGAAHIPIEGMLVSQASPCAAVFGETVTEYGYIIEAVLAADRDPGVGYIILDVDSGGGYVEGVDAAAQAIASVEKRTQSNVHNMAASAAYWLACQADAIVAMTPAAQLGSIGVACEWYDDDEANAREGITHRVFTSTDAPNKRPDFSTEEGQSVLVKELDDLHAVFVSRVASGRGVSAEKVTKDFGRGGILIASDAMAAGMIDDVRGLSISRRKNKPGVAGETASAKDAANKSGGHNVTTLDEFKAANPGVLEAHDKELITSAYNSGVQAERKRRDDLVAFRGINADGDKAVEEAIASGKTFADANPVIQAAVLRGKSTDTADGENAPGVGTASDTVIETPEGMSLEDVAWYKAHGYTDADIAAMAKEEK